jgi:hypothetical protein
MKPAYQKPYYFNRISFAGPALQRRQPEVVTQGGSEVVVLHDAALAQLVQQSVDDEVVLARTRQAADLQGFGRPGVAFLGARQAVRAEVLLADRGRHEVPRGTAVADMIECAEQPGQVERVVERRGDRRDQPDPRGHLTQRRDVHERLLRTDRALCAEGQQVGHEERVEPGRLGQRGDPVCGVEGGPGRVQGQLVGAGVPAGAGDRGERAGWAGRHVRTTFLPFQ